MGNHLYVLAVLLLFTSSLKSQTPLSLSEAIETGLKNSYQIKIEETDLEIAANNNTNANAGKVPTVNFNLVSSNSYSNVNNPVSFIPEINSFSTGAVPSVTLDWVLFEGYRARFTKQQLEKLEAQNQNQLKIAVETTIQSIILSYYDALLQKEQLDVIREVIELSRDRVNYEEVRQEFGQSVTFDVLQTQDAFLNDSTNLLLQQNNYNIALRNLKLAMGVEEQSVTYELTEAFNVPVENYELDDLQSKMLENNNRLQDLFIGRELAAINTKIVESARKPRVAVSTGPTYNWSLTGGSGTTSTGESRTFDGIIGRTFNFGVDLTFSYNLFDGGVRKRNVQNAQLQEVNVQYNINDLKRNLNAQLENTYLTFLNQKAVVKVTEDLLANAKQNLDIAAERFRSGLINSFDYRTIQISYINASQARLAAIFNLKNTETELIRLIGGLVR